MDPISLEVLADHTAESRCDEGFLQVRRLRVQHQDAAGNKSTEYPCDIVSRKHADAVAAVLWYRHQGRPHVVLKAGVRPAVYLRRNRELPLGTEHCPLMLVELVAGVLEGNDFGQTGIFRRAAAEAWEEAGIRMKADEFEMLGGSTFPSPGITDEKVAFVMARFPHEPRAVDRPQGDGSGMEEGTRMVLMELQEAYAACAEGRIADMKTEIGLVRLANRIGWDFVAADWRAQAPGLSY